MSIIFHREDENYLAEDDEYYNTNNTNNNSNDNPNNHLIEKEITIIIQIEDKNDNK